VIDFLSRQNVVVQTLLGTGFTYLMTALGAAVVFVVKGTSRKLLDSMLGFAAGIMIAASYWSLLAPAIEVSHGMGALAWVPAAVGFAAGGVFLRVVDRLLPHLHPGFAEENAEGIKTSWQRSTLLVLAVTLHNIPEGLAVGVAFGAAAYGFPEATLMGAIVLAVGIGIQNFPEGIAVSMPLRGGGMGRLRSFWYGQLSGLVEPAAGVIGAVTVYSSQALLPYALGFAAGAMIFVVVEDVIPESQINGNTDISTMSAMLGFLVMMILDVSFQ